VPSRLDAGIIAQRLKGLAEWTQSGDALHRTLRFKDFLSAMAVVNQIAELAEAQQHHPDILIRYNKVTLTLSTHDSAGITERDFRLAEAIERLVPR
jgi:4a-hydroxytetrahydrobiopterin dehydratase